MLNIVDDHSRFCPGQIVDVLISGDRMARFLNDLALRYGLPEEIVLDNGPEGTSRATYSKGKLKVLPGPRRIAARPPQPSAGLPAVREVAGRRMAVTPPGRRRPGS